MQCNEHANVAWRHQIPALVDQYLCWKYMVDKDVGDDDGLRPPDHIFQIAIIAKRLAESGLADTCAFHSDYFIPTDIVDCFKDDIHRKPGEKDKHATTCTNNWTAAKATQEDNIHVFDQTGIFVLACCHGFVECIAEMRWLAKYGLAAVNQLLDVYGPNQAIGHDIGCAPKKTIVHSSIGDKASELNLVITGFGIEDLEMCECIFSSSNATVSLICHASLFHWTQFIDLHFDQWDKDKYLELSSYSLAQEELVYLQSCAAKPDQLMLAVKYVEHLEKLRFVESTYESVVSSPFLTYMPAEYTWESGLNADTRESTSAIDAEYVSCYWRLKL
ncbi:hypothetical protein EV363DRAFT_1174582 [Boletus edulis]|nr:hypothetical protein EV363DRAFT_1174582 [Boletus edulis]